MQLSSVHNIHNTSRFQRILGIPASLKPLEIEGLCYCSLGSFYFCLCRIGNLYGVKCGVFPTFTFESTVHLDCEVNEVRGYGVRGVSQIKFTMSDSFLVFYDFDILSMIKRKNPFRFYCVILILNLSRLISPITILILKVCRV